MTARALTLALFATLGFAQDQGPTARPESPLVRGFLDPPPETRPWTYWYWVSDNVSREGITRDLEAMARVGIGEALIGNVSLDYVKRGSVKTLSSEWWELIEHAIREGGRLGVDIGIFNCPGWSQSGGPWVKPEQAMRYLVTAEQRVTGPFRFHGKPPALNDSVQDVALLAFRAPRGDGDTVSAHAPKITAAPEAAEVSRLFDGDLATACALPSVGKPITIDVELSEPFSARSLTLHPSGSPFTADCALYAANTAGELRPVRSFRIDRSMMAPNVGPMPEGPVAVSFPPTSSKRFRIVLTVQGGEGGLSEVELRGGARLDRFVEKQLGKMHQKSLPEWDSYLWPREQEPEPEGRVSNDVTDLAARVGPDGALTWDVPEGEWVILRVAMAPTGTRNSPAFPEAQGLEVDKMSRDAVNAHFDAFIGALLARMRADERKALKHVVADSWEMGSQNWTDGLAEAFRARYGYDPLARLPVLTGRVVGSADESDRFLWDLRRLVADRIADDYVGTLRDACRRHGLKLWVQNYGHWGFPAEFLQYGGRADEISGEFWADGDLGRIEMRAASSASHIHGMPVTWAEAFTGGPFFVSTPSSLQPRAQWAFTEGINHFALHLYVHQPNEARPGMNLLVGTEFNRHNTWFDASRSWIDHLRRTQFLLQQGRHVADVAYFIGEDAPMMTGPRTAPLPDGYDFDDINGETIERHMRVEDGRLVLPGGATYRLLVLPRLDTMRPDLLGKIRALVQAGGTVLGPPPQRSPSLQGYPACDGRVRDLADDLWRGCDGTRVTHVRFGDGHVFRGVGVRRALEELGVAPDVGGIDSKVVGWTHRWSGEADVYFLANRSDDRVTVAPVFRVTGRRPEIWRADAGAITRTAVYEVVEGGVRVPVELDPRGAALVVFRTDGVASPSIVEVERDDRTVSSAAQSKSGPRPDADLADNPNTFVFAAWVRPDAETGLPAETDAGVHSNLARNDALFPLHGPSLFQGDMNACAGLSVGRNGVAVYEHSTGYFAPVLVHAAAIEAWTHVAVSYEDGTPTLYLNGKPVRRGLRSRYVVHVTPNIAPRSFDGEMTAVERFARGLGEAGIAELASKVPPSAGVVLTTSTAGVLEADAAVAGSYRLQLADGTALSFEVKPLPAAVELPGPWAVAFPAGMDVPEDVDLERLISWPDHPNPAIQCFSGTATYRRSFVLSEDRRGEGRRVILDLGRVESMAEVIVNGRNLGVLWKPPFLIDVTTVVKAGTNVLQVRVTNAWQNRLIGDLKYPDGFPGAGRLQFKPFTATDIQGRLAKDLAPAGLLGPVRIRAAQRLSVP